MDVVFSIDSNVVVSNDTTARQYPKSAKANAYTNRAARERLVDGAKKSAFMRIKRHPIMDTEAVAALESRKASLDALVKIKPDVFDEDIFSASLSLCVCACVFLSHSLSPERLANKCRFVLLSRYKTKRRQKILREENTKLIVRTKAHQCMNVRLTLNCYCAQVLVVIELLLFRHLFPSKAPNAFPGMARFFTLRNVNDMRLFSSTTSSSSLFPPPPPRPPLLMPCK